MKTPLKIASEKEDIIDKKMPSMVKANKFCWDLGRILEMNEGIRLLKHGRHLIWAKQDNKHFSYFYDAETKTMTIIWKEEGKPSLEEMKEQKRFKQWVDTNFPKEVCLAFKKQGDTSEMKMKDIKIIAKIFTPDAGCTWYLYEYYPESDTFMCFANLGMPQFAEIGTVGMKEMYSAQGALGLRPERDRYFNEKTLEEIYNETNELVTH